MLPLVDEIDCAAETHEFTESPKGASRVETILGKKCRVLPSAGPAKYFAYRIGRQKGLKPGAAYVLAADFPEDTPRSMYVLNRGAEEGRGIQTGAALGDALFGYVDSNPESLRIPLSSAYRVFSALFFLHDRFADIKLPRDKAVRPGLPDEGFWVIVTQPEGKADPLSTGAAVARIRLFAVPDAGKFNVKINFPEGLPRRRLFWREEMADGVVDSRKAEERGVADETQWFEHKARLMQFLGMNTYCKDLLEFGHNQGWDSGPYGGNNWVNQSSTPQRWEKILDMLKRYDFDVLPYYEYAGSVGQKSLGIQRRCVTLGGEKTYTHVAWTEKANADITDPETLEDAKKVLDATITRFKDTAHFAGAWFRPRPSAIPISFSERCLKLFASESNNGAAVAREQLKADAALLKRYYAWWFLKRRDFLAALRDHLREKVNKDALLLYTAYASEPGPAFGNTLVTDDLETWKPILQQPEHKKLKAVSFQDLTGGDARATTRYRDMLLGPRFTWGKWEWQHAEPSADPANYAQMDGVLLTFPFHRAFSVTPEALETFRCKSGLAMVRHYSLNENAVPPELVGYFAADVDRAGPYSMLAEARAVANGDPWYIGYLASSSFNRGFPEYARAFNANFLALPALPSSVLKDASPDAEVVVRAIPTPKHGTYLAIVNTSLSEKKDIAIKFPIAGNVEDAVTGADLIAPGGILKLSFYPCQLFSFRVR